MLIKEEFYFIFILLIVPKHESDKSVNLFKDLLGMTCTMLWIDKLQLTKISWSGFSWDFSF